ncbi:23S rRNA (guanosine(2251)-2'-O)-methyltransferase RlmB [Vallitalea longa]|uniref:23S rRNA (Guanosine(2251)-2'-O)-methyltransferase RlmB n=1 Tax=Vallitalea longa TaxID=2936439 RepID=A0A9W5YEQ0_9FIRM|nr:23S rRNA (guanosine(2251)-2'-O)-methyltransferase RlmB [Vallitalea longa]GKX32142.1 23S rRNA (guanosine(2251)-2'-O)-methyltransferase RlmB [Vallitalea longa]
MDNNDLILEGRNAVAEALKADRSIDKVFIIDGKHDGPLKKIVAEARKRNIIVNFVNKDKLNDISITKKHQGVIAYAAAYNYVDVKDIVQIAADKGEAPFIIILDSIEDPHNLGAILRTANIVGVHGIIIPKRRAVGLTSTVAKTSAGAIEYTKVARVTNVARTIDELKKEGFWIACADMEGDLMYDVDLKGSLAIVIGNEGEGVSKNVKDKCDFIVKVPMKGDITSLNASVAAGVLTYEALRQREYN